MAKFKLRAFISSIPWLNTLVIETIIFVYTNGILALDRSYRLVRVISPKARPYVNKTGIPAIYAIYHQHMVGIMGMHPRKNLTVLISASRDGHMIAKAAENFGFTVARGSSGRDAVKGALEMVDAAKAGQHLAFMVDGPRGPVYEVKPGVVRLAQICNVPIVPIGVAARGSWYMGSWDSFNVASWGTPLVTIFGDPIFVDADASEEETEAARLAVDSALRKLSASAGALWAAS